MYIYFKFYFPSTFQKAREILKKRGWKWSSGKDLVVYTPSALTFSSPEILCLFLKEKEIVISTFKEAYLRTIPEFYCITVV